MRLTPKLDKKGHFAKISNRKAMWGWALYDWANSAFATTVMAGFFPIFFKTFWSYGVHANLSTARLGFANAIAGLIVALMAPLLGAIADAGSARKKFLIFFAYQGVLATVADDAATVEFADVAPLTEDPAPVEEAVS